MKNFRIRKETNFSWHTAAILLFILIVYIMLAADLQAALPEPPKIGNTQFDKNDPVGYIVSSIKYVIFLGLTAVVVFAIIGFSSGLIAEVNEARKNGEWGRFAIYFGVGIFVILVIIFGAWWASVKLSETIKI